ncbi:MAG: asparagine synthase-related protein [Nesterenkonia sp.]
MVERTDEPTAVCGAFGDLTQEHRSRVAGMAQRARAEGVGLSVDHQQAGIVVFGSSALQIAQLDDGTLAAAWNAAGAADPADFADPAEHTDSWTETARAADACGFRILDGTGVVHGSVSGAQVIYIYASEGAVFFSTRLRWLADTAHLLTPDWQSWAEILAFGAPLEGRTTFAEFRRLMPMEYIQLDETGTAQMRQAHWPWEDYTPQTPASLDEVTRETVEQMAATMCPYLEPAGPANPMLSGGRDSRMLTALALREAQQPDQVTAWTTSSDAGSALEELIGARVAQRLGVRQQIIVGGYADFGQDFRRYADAVDYQASFHFWLTPVAQRLRQQPGPVFDGLGGGVFFGGGFADPPDAGTMNTAELIEARIAARTRYLSAGHKVLTEPGAQAVSTRSRARAVPLVEKYFDHPNGHTLAAYRMRSVPGIAQAPAKVLGGARPTVMPMIGDAVVRLALQLPHSAKADGAWYPDLLAASDPRLRGMATADDLIGTHHHKRRIASREGAGYLARLIQGSAVRDLLSKTLAEADPEDPHGLVIWQRLLNSQRPQHLIRGLAVLALWLEDYGSQLTDTDPRRILDAG